MISYMINYLMTMATIIFVGHLGKTELAAASLGNNGIQTFAYGLLVLSLCVPIINWENIRNSAMINDVINLRSDI